MDFPRLCGSRRRTRTELSRYTMESGRKSFSNLQERTWCTYAALRCCAQPRPQASSVHDANSIRLVAAPFRGKGDIVPITIRGVSLYSILLRAADDADTIPRARTPIPSTTRVTHTSIMRPMDHFHPCHSHHLPNHL